jgi:dephospho-CoA kinase
MKIVGLTGNIGSGKSTVARLIVEAGVPVIDADRVAREVVAPGMPALREIEARFPGVLAADGQLDRAALAARVFAAPDERKALEAILHPRIALEVHRQLHALEESGCPLAIYEAALIVENGMQHGQDGLIVVTVPPDEQLRRVLARDRMSEAEARTRIAAQLSQEEKARAATLVIDNAGPIEALPEQVKRVLQTLRASSDAVPTAQAKREVR